MAAADPKALFLTWRTYGTWLPGDERGWVSRNRNGYGEPMAAADHRLEAAASGQMTRPPTVFSDPERQEVDEIIRHCCEFHGWPILALAVRTNHVHIVVASNEPPGRVMNGLKSRVTRVLRERVGGRSLESPWARGGSTRVIWDDVALEAAVRYVKFGQ